MSSLKTEAPKNFTYFSFFVKCISLYIGLLLAVKMTYGSCVRVKISCKCLADKNYDKKRFKKLLIFPTKNQFYRISPFLKLLIPL